MHTQTMCPLLSATAPAPPEEVVAAQVENLLLEFAPVHAVPRVQTRYIHGGELAADVDIDVASTHNDMTVTHGLAADAKKKLLVEVADLRHTSISSRLVFFLFLFFWSISRADTRSPVRFWCGGVRMSWCEHELVCIWCVDGVRPHTPRVFGLTEYDDD